MRSPWLLYSRLSGTTRSLYHLEIRQTPGLHAQLRSARRLSQRAETASGERGYNPLDPLQSRSRAQKSAKNDAAHFKRLSAAALACMGIVAGIVLTVDPSGGAGTSGSSKNTLKADSSRSGGETFQGSRVVVAPGGAKLVAQVEAGEDVELVPTGNSSVPHFPRTIHLPTDSEPNNKDSEYTLIGLGIRTVSFLKIQVYVVGLYVRTTSLSKIQSRLVKRVNPLATTLLPGERDELRLALLDPEKSYLIWDVLLKESSNGLDTAFRVVPTRGTDFQHLRDGWMRGIISKTQAASQRGDKEFSDDSFGRSVKEFSALFGGKGKAPKGSVVLLTRDGSGKLDMMHQSSDEQITHLGSVEDERISRLIWLGYLGGKSVSSEAARKEIIDGIMALVERPVGTAAAKVT
jgi:hypothetical protein